MLVGGAGEELGYQGDDILPEAAEDMGSGQCVCGDRERERSRELFFLNEYCIGVFADCKL